MNNKTTQIQQGDVLLSRVESIPAGSKKIEDERGVVLAEGEHTGHFHGTDQGGVELLEAPDKKRYLVVSGSEPASINHQEHKPVIVPPGIYQIGIVQEYDWFEQMARNVVD